MKFFLKHLFQWRTIFLLGTALAVRLALAPFPGFVGDTTGMVQYVRTMGHDGFTAVNHNPASIERYPALFVYHTYLLSIFAGKHFQSPDSLNADGDTTAESSLTERMIFRTIPIAYDILVGALLLVFISLLVSRSAGEIGAAVYLFNPGTIMNSALWNYDSMPSFYILLAVIFCGAAIYYGRVILWDMAWLATGLAFCSKLQGGMLVPLIGLLALSYRLRLFTLIRHGGIFIAVIALAYAPLLIGQQWDYFRRLFVVSFQTFATTHVNGYNLWALWFQMPVDQRVLGVPLETWGRLFYFGALAWLGWQIWKQKISRGTGIDGVRRITIAAAYGCLAPFMLLTRMHERYVAYAIPICILAAMLDRRLRTLMWGISATYALNLFVVLNSYGQLWTHFGAGEGLEQSLHVCFCVIRFFCALLNVGLFLWMTSKLPELLSGSNQSPDSKSFA